MWYNLTTNVLQIIIKESQALLQSWGAVQHSPRLYNLARDM